MPQIIPIKDLKNTSEISDLCHSTTEPVLKMYQSLMNSEQQIKEGKVHDASESLKSVREKYGL